MRFDHSNEIPPINKIASIFSSKRLSQQSYPTRNIFRGLPRFVVEEFDCTLWVPQQNSVSCTFHHHAIHQTMTSWKMQFFFSSLHTPSPLERVAILQDCCNGFFFFLHVSSTKPSSSRQKSKENSAQDITLHHRGKREPAPWLGSSRPSLFCERPPLRIFFPHRLRRLATFTQSSSPFFSCVLPGRIFEGTTFPANFILRETSTSNFPLFTHQNFPSLDHFLSSKPLRGFRKKAKRTRLIIRSLASCPHTHKKHAAPHALPSNGNFIGNPRSAHITSNRPSPRTLYRRFCGRDKKWLECGHSVVYEEQWRPNYTATLQQHGSTSHATREPNQRTNAIFATQYMA